MTPVNKKKPNKLTIVFDLVRFEILVWLYIFFSSIRSGYVHSLLVLITSLYGSLNIYDLLHAISIYLYILYIKCVIQLYHVVDQHILLTDMSVTNAFWKGIDPQKKIVAPTTITDIWKNVAPESDKGCVKRYRLLSRHYFNGQCGKSFLIFQWKL